MNRLFKLIMTTVLVALIGCLLIAIFLMDTTSIHIH
jgi:hypothetical protein